MLHLPPNGVLAPTLRVSKTKRCRFFLIVYIDFQGGNGLGEQKLREKLFGEGHRAAIHLLPARIFSSIRYYTNVYHLVLQFLSYKSADIHIYTHTNKFSNI